MIEVNDERRNLIKPSPNAAGSMTANDSDDQDLDLNQLRNASNTSWTKKRNLWIVIVLAVLTVSAVIGYFVYHYLENDNSNTSVNGTALSGDATNANNNLAVGPIDMSLTQKSVTGPPLLPGIYLMNKMYNAFLGKQIYEQSGVDIIDYTFNGRYSSDTSGETYEIPMEFRSIPNIEPSCDMKSKVNSVHYTASSSVLKEQGYSVSGGYDAKFKITAGVEAKGAKAGVETEQSYGAMFGHSSTSKSARAQASDDYTYSFSMEATNTYYQAEMDWGIHNPMQFQWKQPFLDAVDNMNRNPSNKSIMAFINEWGSHVLRKMQTGSICKETGYISHSATESEVETFHQEVSTQSFSYAYWKLDAKEQSSKTSSGSTSSTVDHRFDDIHCVGEVKVTATSCATLTSDANNPIVTSYKSLQFWKIQEIKDRLNQSTIDNVELFFKYILDSLAECATENCNGKGVCTLEQDIWDDDFIEEWNGMDFRNLWNSVDNEYCFCEDNLFGADCEACKCTRTEGCCCDDNNACDAGLLCSPKDKICIAKSSTNECGTKGQFIECPQGVAIGGCGSGKYEHCQDSGLCAGNSFTGLQCGYSALGTRTSNGQWRCNADNSWAALNCQNDQNGNGLMIGVCGSGTSPECNGDCTGGVGILCASIEGVSVDVNQCNWEKGTDNGRNFNEGEFILCPDGYVGTGYCGSGSSADCDSGSGTVNTLILCCKLVY